LGRTWRDLETEVDKMVYAVYGLIEDEVKAVEGKE
jgi:hypothetical protein